MVGSFEVPGMNGKWMYMSKKSNYIHREANENSGPTEFREMEVFCRALWHEKNKG